MKDLKFKRGRNTELCLTSTMIDFVILILSMVNLGVGFFLPAAKPTGLGEQVGR